jgi:hypothetical protein
MAEIKTQVNDASVEDFINSVENETRRKDGLEVLKMYKRVTGLEPRMWGSSIIGFGMYHYKSERSSQEGDWPLAAFSPRKQNLTLYVYPRNHPELLKDLGKHTTSVGCLYINKLDDVNLKVLEKLVAASYEWAQKEFGKR